MYKSLFMVFAAFLLCAGMSLADEMADDETAEVVNVTFTGVATEFTLGDMPGAATIWAVSVTSDEEGALCSDVINVTVAQALAPPWGFFDENVTAGDEVEVFGAYDETECSVTLHGSADYYFMLAVEDEVAEDEVVEDEVVEETNETTEETVE